jgi:hypothetical protein
LLVNCCQCPIAIEASLRRRQRSLNPKEPPAVLGRQNT